MTNNDGLRLRIAEELKKARIDAGLSATDAAKALGKCKNTIYSWEIGRILPTADMLIRAMILYGIHDFNTFLGSSDQQSPPTTPKLKADLTQEQTEILDLVEHSNEQGISAARAVLRTFKK